MKFLRPTIGVFILALLLAVNGYARPLKSGCDSLGRINNIFYTSCFPWQSSDGTITTGSSTVNNDTPRLKYLLESSSTIGKIIFDEEGYYINDSIILYGYRTVIGSGRAPINSPTVYGYASSRIVQTASDKAIFTIGGATFSSAIRDLALVGGIGTTGTVGILAQNGTTAATSTLSSDFEFTNLTFGALSKGIYVNAQSYGGTCATTGVGCEGFWRFDNVKLDHVKFESCSIGVHVNSKNSGWSMRNIIFFTPTGNALPGTDAAPSPITASNIGGLTLGVYLQRIGYSTLEELIGDGNNASAMIYVGEHANLNIQSSIDEGFKNSIFIYGGDINNPVNITNNQIQAKMTVRNSTIVSTGNQFQSLAPNPDPKADPPSPPYVQLGRAILSSKVYSIGDRFCFDYPAGNSTCTEAETEAYSTDASSEIVFSSNRYRNSLQNLRFGVKPYQYDVARNIYNGLLEFKGEQTGGYAGYSFGTPVAAVKVNNDGSVTYGTKNYAELTAGSNLIVPSPDGTVIYCSNCQKTTPCSTGGSGALAKRINGSWDCD